MTGTLFILFATFFWALDTLIRYPLLEAGLTPIQIVLTEHAILVLCLLCWLRARGQSLWPFVSRDWLSLLVIGGLGSALGTLAFTEAFSYMNPTLVILLQKLQPLVAISLAAFVLKERVPLSYMVCLLVAFAGSFLLMVEDITSLVGSHGWHYSAELGKRFMGYGLAFIAVVSWGASTVFGKKLALQGYTSGQIMNGRFLVGFIVLLPFFAMQSPFEQSVTVSLTVKIMLMVGISGVLGMVLYYQGLLRVQSKHSAIAEMGFPLMAGVINWVVLGFGLSVLQIVGGLLLLIASFAVHIPFKPRPQLKANLT